MVEESRISRALNFYNNAISLSYRRSQIVNSVTFQKDLSAISKLQNELGTCIKLPLENWLDMAGCLWTVLGGKWSLLQNMSRGSGLKKHIKLSSQLSTPEVMLRTKYLINDREVLTELKLRCELCYYMWAGSRGQYNDWLRAERSRDRIPVGAKFSAPAQTGAGAHPASCTMRTGSFLG
jgi:hypothetical protein